MHDIDIEIDDEVVETLVTNYVNRTLTEPSISLFHSRLEKHCWRTALADAVLNDELISIILEKIRLQDGKDVI